MAPGTRPGRRGGGVASKRSGRKGERRQRLTGAQSVTWMTGGGGRGRGGEGASELNAMECR